MSQQTARSERGMTKCHVHGSATQQGLQLAAICQAVVPILHIASYIATYTGQMPRQGHAKQILHAVTKIGKQRVYGMHQRSPPQLKAVAGRGRSTLAAPCLMSGQVQACLQPVLHC